MVYIYCVLIAGILGFFGRSGMVRKGKESTGSSSLFVRVEKRKPYSDKLIVARWQVSALRASDVFLVVVNPDLTVGAIS